jgi:hypothetical protein
MDFVGGQKRVSTENQLGAKRTVFLDSLFLISAMIKYWWVMEE